MSPHIGLTNRRAAEDRRSAISLAARAARHPRHASGTAEIPRHTKLEMFQDQVFCFTPKGDLIALPRGLTAVDFAYAVHSEIGDTCVGAKINGRLLPLRNPGQRRPGRDHYIEGAGAIADLGALCRLRQGAGPIRRFVRTQQRTQYLDLGNAIVQKAFRQEGHEFSERPLEPVPQYVLTVQPSDDLYIAVGQGLPLAGPVCRFPQRREAAASRQRPRSISLGRVRREGGP